MGLWALAGTFFREFSTAKSVTIIDWRLGAFNKLCMVLIFFYVAFNLLMSKQYLKTVLPLGSTAHWVGTSPTADMTFTASGKRSPGDAAVTANYAGAVKKMKGWINDQNNFGYCGNSDYDFAYSADWNYGPYNCAFKPSSQLWSKTAASLFVTLSEEITKRRSFAAPAGVDDDAGCKTSFSNAGLSCRNDGAWYSAIEEGCVCSETDYEFNVAAEHLAIEFDHSFTSSSADSTPGGAQSKPRTIVKVKGCTETSKGSCDLMEFKQGDTVSIPVQRMLDFMSIDLDSDGCNQPGGDPGLKVNGICPRVRVTGMNIQATISYYNYNQFSSSFTFDPGEPTAVLELDPSLTWTSMGNDIQFNPEPSWGSANGVSSPEENTNRYRYGIRIVFTSSTGSIGKFDVVTTMNILIQGLVLMGLAGQITTYAAQNWLGVVSKTYSAAINEELSFTKEVARFACQSLAANEIFKHIDTDGSNSLDKSELHAKLREFLKFTLEPDEIEKCATAVFEMLDRRGVGEGIEKENEKAAWAGESTRGIDVTEFIDFLTDDRITPDIVKAMITTNFNAYQSDTILKSLGDKMTMMKSFSNDSKDLQGKDQPKPETQIVHVVPATSSGSSDEWRPKQGLP